jgi:Ni/Co efflux regulator RcnB
MKILFNPTFALCLAVATPTALLAQGGRHEQSSSHGSEHGASRGGQPVQHTHSSGSSSGASQPHWTTSGHSSTHGTTYHHHSSGSTTHHHHGTSHTTVNVHVRETSHVNIDIRTYRRNVTAEHRFHYGEYHGPRGYAYRRWSYGEHLPKIYFASNFWISNYLNFGLAWAPDGCVWVRFGPDAILVDEGTGEIIQVVYGVFY